MGQHTLAYDAVVLAGGQARRFGADKLAAELAGRTLLDHALLTLAGLRPPAAPPRRFVLVGPPRPTPPGLAVHWCREDPPGGGPLAAVGAATPLLTAPWVVIVAGDMPLAGRAVPDLLAAVAAPHAPPWQAAVLVSTDGRTQPLTCLLRRTTLFDRLAQLAPLPGRPARALLEGLRVAKVPEPAGVGWSADVDRPDDLDVAGSLVRPDGGPARRRRPSG